ncbi:hypothetical protein ALC56_07531 [Trachymyrmex septentrionalis]|uniref:Uncharacterized protein n=1 Tax=Trachymyrmex septentrionalis TaxID=34720 RepID=A0A195FCL1_9HYME|nr:hypothetical protein ALC56_07531 [Trachymyrmex septentrionalis]
MGAVINVDYIKPRFLEDAREIVLDRVLSSYAYEQHEVFSIGYYVRCSYDDALSSYQFRRDKGCIAWFARQFNDLAHRVKNIISANMPMETLSKEQLEAYHRRYRDALSYCEKSFTSDNMRVRDHCHLTGRYRGPAHSNCNLFDLAHYYTLPGFTWDAMLKHTRVKFELLTDINMIMFIERNIRGSLSQCSGRYAQANNKYMHSYDLSEPSSYLIYCIKMLTTRHSLRITKIQRVLQFAQSPWLRDYIELNTRTMKRDIARFDTSDYLTYNATISKSKIALSLYDDKRYVVPETLPWGH